MRTSEVDGDSAPGRLVLMILSVFTGFLIFLLDLTAKVQRDAQLMRENPVEYCAGVANPNWSAQAARTYNSCLDFAKQEHGRNRKL